MIAQAKPKRHHHTVWQLYLKPWTTKGAIWCLQGGRIFRTGTRNVAVEKDFYRLHELTLSDVALIRMFLDKAHQLAKRNHAHLLNMLMVPFEIAGQLRNSKHRTAIDKALNHYASEALENYHASIEASFIPSLESTLRDDISFYQDDAQCIPFLHYLCTQYMRTKGIKDRVIESCNTDLSSAWNILIHVFAMNIGASLFLERRRRKLILIHNRTYVSFVTGDQPAINLKGTRPNPPENLSIYYPIAPKLALLLADVDEQPAFTAEGLTSEQASVLNRTLFESCYRQAFADSRGLLAGLRSDHGFQ